ncbi:ATPase associated with various cellular activities AAA_5 [Crinalium epipsammum PCC 9333]|uniref:ATPase associated with various cellular activities AAA_5 n=1 Tax=Crinalium epipsammum PCC 9333 TaxID=1173022 RepID=K9VWY1_9CYAN|nr:AAA family ATPase [Crinalium epipsammum]AFZ12496.1 ATPase associated with various cellular activities AAA_5 [Crinalium epipsammum PCC 9333]
MNKTERLKNLTLPCTPTLLVTALTLFLGGGIEKAAGAAGVTAAASAATATIVSRRQHMRANYLEGRLGDIENVSQLVAQRDNMSVIVESLNAEIAHRREERRELDQTLGDYPALQTQHQYIQREINTLSQQQQELEGRIATLHQQNPQLSYLEELTRRIEQHRLELSSLEGQITANRTQIDQLEQQRASLQAIEVRLPQKQAELNFLQENIASQQTLLHDLEQRTVELELLRATYDALFNEREQLENRISYLQPEVNRLQEERDHILREIQENTQKYQESEGVRREIERINAELRAKRAELASLHREIERLESQRVALENNIHDLEQKEEELERILQRLRGEINEIENSARVALQALRDKLWYKLPPQQRSAGNEIEFLEEFKNYLTTQGLNFPDRIIRAFHTSLKVQDISALVILAGISGTGKSELPRQYAEFIGAQFLMLPVQPRWDSPQDLQGFYNYVEKKYKPTELMRGLYQYKHDANLSGRMVIVLLDEMNLARVEYYFSDFLSKLETRRSHQTFLSLDVGSLPLPESEKQIKIPDEFLFVGTMNEDETTQSLSDKVLDRANVLTFGKPSELQLRANKTKQTATNSQSYLTYQDFRSNWGREPNDYLAILEQVKDYVNQANDIMEKMGHPFAHRVYQSIAKYVINYPGVESSEEALRCAIADQFGQKILPKLRGVMVADMEESFALMENLVIKLQDKPLTDAFIKARQGRYGQFHWQGLVY